MEIVTHKNFKTVKIHECIYLMAAHADYLIMEWESNPVNDMVADSIVSLVLQIEANLATHTLIGYFLPFSCQLLIFNQSTISMQKGLLVVPVRLKK